MRTELGNCPGGEETHSETQAAGMSEDDARLAQSCEALQQLTALNNTTQHCESLQQFQPGASQEVPGHLHSQGAQATLSLVNRDCAGLEGRNDEAVAHQPVPESVAEANYSNYELLVDVGGAKHRRNFRALSVEDVALHIRQDFLVPSDVLLRYFDCSWGEWITIDSHVELPQKATDTVLCPTSAIEN